MSEIEKKWYVLRAVSGKENKVKEYLDADIKHGNLGDYVSQVLIPTEKTYQVRNGKKIVKERTYLPGYVLVEAALVGEVAHHLRNTPNASLMRGKRVAMVASAVRPNWRAMLATFMPILPSPMIPRVLPASSISGVSQ